MKLLKWKNTLSGCWATIFKITTLFVFSSNLAFAKFTVEPHWDKLQGTISNYQDDKVKFSGDMNGINIGYLGENVMAGMVMQLGRLSFKKDPTGDGEKYFKAGGIGTYLGFHFRGTIKIWSEYQNTNIEPTTANDRRYFGQQVSFGLGYRIYDGVLINYKYFNNYYTQKEDDTTGKTSSLDRNMRTFGQSFGLSFIFVW